MLRDPTCELDRIRAIFMNMRKTIVLHGALLLPFLAGSAWGQSETQLNPQNQDGSDPTTQTQQDASPSRAYDYDSDCVMTAQGCITPAGSSSSGYLGNSSGDAVFQRSSPNEIAPLRQQFPGQLAQRRQPLPPLTQTEFQNFVASTTGVRLSIFGSNLFRRNPDSFSPSQLSPVSSDYVIGPDDELRVRISGATNYSGNLRVDRAGSIFIPQVGAVQVAGLRFSQLDQRLRSSIANEYKNFDLSVEAGRLRSIQVYLAGQVVSPGAYQVSAMSTLVNGLFAGGGPNTHGSLRHLLLKRDGKVVADFDLYGLLLRGDKTGDIRLQPEDVVFVPAVGPEAAILGSVRDEAIYELREGEVLSDLIKAAAGPTAIAAQSKVLIDRASSGSQREGIDIAYDQISHTAVYDGDIVRILPSIPSYRDTVTLRGRVANAGRMTWRPGMRLSDLIPDRDSLLSRNYWWQRSHLGLPSQEFQSDVVAPPVLARKFKQDVNSSDNTVGETVDAEHSTTKASVADLLASDPTTSAATTNDNFIRVRLTEEDIDWNYAVIERTNPEDLKTRLIPFDLGELVEKHDPSQNLPLEAGDVVTIFSVRDLRQPVDLLTKYVTVEGEVGHPGVYSVHPGETLAEVVSRAGGLDSKAYLYAAEFTRESARRFQQRRIDEYVQEVDLEVRRGALDAANASLTGAAITSANTLAQDRFLEQLRKLRATGRVILGVHPNTVSLATLPPFELENGDRFVVPSRPATISIVGAVYNPNVFLIKPDLSVKEYLLLAGGPTRNADSSKMFIVRADGSTENRSTKSGIFGDAFLRIRLNPGDTLIVPEKRLRPNIALKTFTDYTQIFSQLALGAAAISILQ
jgi:protein involved in polysaccharide export with SLBB domain